MEGFYILMEFTLPMLRAAECIYQYKLYRTQDVADAVSYGAGGADCRLAALRKPSLAPPPLGANTGQMCGHGAVYLGSYYRGM